jgi:hypothetical protein
MSTLVPTRDGKGLALRSRSCRSFLQRGRPVLAHHVDFTIQPTSAAGRTGHGRPSASATGFGRRTGGGQRVGELHVHYAQRERHADSSLQVRFRRCGRAGGPSRLVASGCLRRRLSRGSASFLGSLTWSFVTNEATRRRVDPAPCRRPGSIRDMPAAGFVQQVLAQSAGWPACA